MLTLKLSDLVIAMFMCELHNGSWCNISFWLQQQLWLWLQLNPELTISYFGWWVKKDPVCTLALLFNHILVSHSHLNCCPFCSLPLSTYCVSYHGFPAIVFHPVLMSGLVFWLPPLWAMFVLDENSCQSQWWVRDAQRLLGLWSKARGLISRFTTPFRNPQLETNLKNQSINQICASCEVRLI